MSKLIFLKDLENLDFKELGLICGIEIHQQLNTGKLFCSCPCEIVPNDKLNDEIIRKLRFSIGETGDVDRAAIEEFKKGKTNTYKYNSTNACLVDLDEEPPHVPNQKAIQTALGVGLMLNLTFFDKIAFMRKLIIDGSITSGFQRTSQIGFAGQIETSFGKVSIDAINIEEDSCRIIERQTNKTIFSLDRQGIPLIEITTGPNMHNPQEAQEVAKQLGDLLRSYDTTKRGIGTIRQDLNVSIKDGARVEIKGAQNLKLIPEIIEAEIKRQKILISIREELKNRGKDTKNFTDFKITDISNIFKKSNSKVINENLKEENSIVLAIKLFNFKGLLGHELQENHRFATEISDKNKKAFSQIKGLFHSDELPKYGIEQNQVDKIREELKLKSTDSFIFIVQEKKMAKESLKNIIILIQELLKGVPSEVRQVDPKGTKTNFLRPMPGSARMYPETDVAEIPITDEDLENSKKILPEIYSKKINRLSKEWKIDENKLKETLESYNEEEIKKLIKASSKNAQYLYSVLFELPKDIKKREKIDIIDFKISLLEDLLKTANEKNLTQQTIRDIFVSLYKDRKQEVESIQDYLNQKGFSFEQIDEKEIEKKIKEIVDKNQGAPFGALMGICMAEFKGKVEGKIISNILKRLQ